MGLEHKIIIWPDVPLYDHQKTAWAEDARRYEDNPDEFFNAWHYVNNHPVFWHYQFYSSDEGPKVSEFVTDCWGFGSLGTSTGLRRTVIPHTAPSVSVHVYPIDETGHFREPEALDVHTEIWLEAGHIVMQPDPEQGWQNAHFHDPDLGCGAPTYEEAVIKLARLIWDKYGNDREVADSNK